jgi:hypothetical protein
MSELLIKDVFIFNKKMMRYSEWESVGESSEPELKTTIQSDQI